MVARARVRDFGAKFFWEARTKYRLPKAWRLLTACEVSHRPAHVVWKSGHIKAQFGKITLDARLCHAFALVRTREREREGYLVRIVDAHGKKANVKRRPMPVTDAGNEGGHHSPQSIWVDVQVMACVCYCDIAYPG